ncbi:MAG TPA: GNAT family N-acetyltransferase [Sphingomicrobium sp.]|jgi:ribosomal-protein-alanine N-acetyltransferase|nr:GNAT family N-acetyltransferase [Sphingomicrobium sp.]
MSTVHSPRPVPLQPASWDQLDAIMAVMSQAFDPDFGEAWTRAQCAGILPMQGVRMILAGTEDRPLGFSLMRSVADESELLLLAVAPDARRLGVGSSLVEDFVANARSFGASRVHLEVRDGNPAVDLYRRHRFSIEGRRSNYYRGTDGRQFDALTMARLT